MSEHTWDSSTYDRDFSFVAAYGETILGWLDPTPASASSTWGAAPAT